MKYLLDTCVISDFFKKHPNVIKRFKYSSPRDIAVSTITLMEIDYGLKLNPERENKIRPLWQNLLQNISMISYMQHEAIATAHIRARLKTEGRQIGPFDILLAGSALAHNLIFVTSNTKEFERLPELVLENWRN